MGMGNAVLVARGRGKWMNTGYLPHLAPFRPLCARTRGIACRVGHPHNHTVLPDRPDGLLISRVILPFTRVRLHSRAKGHLLP